MVRRWTHKEKCTRWDCYCVDDNDHEKRPDLHDELRVSVETLRATAELLEEGEDLR